MATRLTTGACNEMNDTGFRGMFAGGFADIYSGAQPATANLAPTGTLLASIPLPNPCFAASVDRVLALTGSWTVDEAIASGVASYARFRKAGDSGGVDDSEERMDVDVSEAGGGGQLIIDNENIVVDEPVTITAFTWTQPSE